MTDKITSPAADVVEFETAMNAVLRAHSRHLAAVTAASAAEARYSRRALYDALKDYRRKETMLYRGKVGAVLVAEEEGETGPA